MRMVLTAIAIALLASNAMLAVQVHNLSVEVSWLKREVWDQGKALEYTQQHTPGIPHNEVYSDK